MAIRIALLCLVLSTATIRLDAAGSGNLWFRPWSTPNVLLRFEVPAAGNQTIAVESSGLGGAIDLEIFDSCDRPVFSSHLNFAGAGEQASVVGFPAAGNYSMRLTGKQQFQGRIQIHTSAAHFVVPGIADFDAPFELTHPRQGTYYFYVPANVTQFRFRLWVPDGGEDATASVRGPDGTVRLTASLDGSDSTYLIAADPASRAAFWKLDITHTGDVRFGVLDIPNWFAETPDAWFVPDVTCSPETLTVVPATSVMSNFVLLVTLAVVGAVFVRIRA